MLSFTFLFQYLASKEKFLQLQLYHVIFPQLRAPAGSDPKIRVYDADHERRRKEQLNKLFNRSQEQIDEEEYLLAELKKIEQRKKERDRKTQDLQKLISASENNLERRTDRKTNKKKTQPQLKIMEKQVSL